MQACVIRIVTWGLTARIAEPEKQPLLGTVGGDVFCVVRAGAI
jgi:hypothetical protein